MNKVVIFDFDLVLSDSSWSNIFLKDYNNDYGEIYKVGNFDKPIMQMIDLMNLLFNNNYKIVVMTARIQEHKDTVVNFLNKHNAMYHDIILADNSHKGNVEGNTASIKQTMLMDYLFDNLNDKIEYVIEDNLDNIRMFREQGITCLQLFTNLYSDNQGG